MAIHDIIYLSILGLGVILLTTFYFMLGKSTKKLPDSWKKSLPSKGFKISILILAIYLFITLSGEIVAFTLSSMGYTIVLSSASIWLWPPHFYLGFYSFIHKLPGSGIATLYCTLFSSDTSLSGDITIRTAFFRILLHWCFPVFTFWQHFCIWRTCL